MIVKDNLILKVTRGLCFWSDLLSLKKIPNFSGRVKRSEIVNEYCFLRQSHSKKNLGMLPKFYDFMGLSNKQYFFFYFIVSRRKTFYKFLVK